MVLRVVRGRTAEGSDARADLFALLDDSAATDWVVLCRVVAGDRSLEPLLAGLDDIGAAMVATTVERLTGGTRFAVVTVRYGSDVGRGTLRPGNRSGAGFGAVLMVIAPPTSGAKLPCFLIFPGGYG